SREAAGSPFFLREIVRHQLATAGEGGAVQVIRLERVVEERIAGLPPDARGILGAVALAGYPVPEPVAVRAAGIQDAAPTALAVLRAAHLVLTRGGTGTRLLEAYHDRIREAAVERLTAGERRSLHLSLAEALLTSPDPDPERLAHHFL